MGCRGRHRPDLASMPTADAVVEYSPATGKEVRRLAIKGNPAQMVLKGHWLVAACPKEAAAGTRST